MRSLFASSVTLLALALTFRAPGQEREQVPLRNWAAPPYWAPSSPSDAATTSPARSKSAQPPRQTLAVLTNPMPFTAIDPCRVVDTRVGQGFAGEYGPPALSTAATRTFTITGQCGIPATALAVSFQFTVVNMTSGGNFRAWPDTSAMPTASVLNWTATQGVAGNGVVVPIGTDGGLSIYVNGPAGNTVDLVLDVGGYYAPQGAFSHLLGVGYVRSDGTPSTSLTNLGTWTSSRTGLGTYGISFAGLNPGCTTTSPTILLSLGSSGWAYNSSIFTSCNSGNVTIYVSTRSTADAAADRGFSFLVYGASPASSALTAAPGGRIPSTCTFTVSTGVETCE